MNERFGYMWVIVASATAVGVGVVLLLKRDLDARVSTGPSVVASTGDHRSTNTSASSAKRRLLSSVPISVNEVGDGIRFVTTNEEMSAPGIPPPMEPIDQPLSEEMERRARHFVSTDEKGAADRLDELRSVGERAAEGDNDAIETIMAVARSQVCLSGDAIGLLAKVNKPEVAEVIARLAFARDPVRSVAAIKALPSLVDRDRVAAVVSGVLKNATEGRYMDPARVRATCVETMSVVRSPACLKIVERELDALPVDTAHLEYGSQLVGLARSIGGHEAPILLGRYAERLVANRPKDPVSGGYFDQKIVEVRKSMTVGGGGM